jgi:predicted AlkP superfamily pyrophosphatase or phosphodiesterase
MLTGAPPSKHGVKSNNFGQKIKVEALADFIPTRLYGSMHVSHFSRTGWEVKTFSLVDLGYDQADNFMTEELKQDVLKSPRTELWVVDFSRVDYAGHAWGSYSRQYYESITMTDSLIKDFVRWLQKEGMLEETLVVISSDHGLFIGEHSFLLSKTEEFVPLIFLGKGIFPLEFRFPVSIMDICSNISFALGQRYCNNDRGRVFAGLFNKTEESQAFRQRISGILKS